jgi:hypothetical protein
MKLNYQSISFHPKLAFGLDLVLGLVFLWWLTQINVWWVLLLWVGFRLALWAIMVRLAYFSLSVSRWPHYFSLTVFGLGSLLLLIFSDWSGAWVVLGGASALFPALSFWFLPAKEIELSFEKKSYRRWRFLLSIFGLTGIVSGMMAIATFQLFYNVSNAIWWFAAAIVATVVALWWWREYGIKWSRRVGLWAFMFFLLMAELVGILMLWPIGYLADGLLIVWWWYILWLLVRFHLSSDGIVWKKQTVFLAFSAVAMILFLVFAVRWK